MQFDFGKNWMDFSENALTRDRVDNAVHDFSELFEGIQLQGKTFLDIGFGQGLNLLAAASMGANVIGCDINDKCGEAVKHNRKFFPALDAQKVHLEIGSILLSETVKKLKKLSKCDSGFDVVHSWGVLHHTGDMQRAFRNAVSLVSPGGYFIVSIYNKHWSSPLWRWIKFAYCSSPEFIKKIMISVLYPVIVLAKTTATHKNPFKKERGMGFYHDVVDWVGGHPYEYGSRIEIETLIKSFGFDLVRFNPADVPTGCNEYVFRNTIGTEA